MLINLLTECNEYSKLTVDLVSALPLVPAPEPVPMYVPKCEYTPLELIVGGVETKPKEFPHMVMCRNIVVGGN